MKLILFFRSYVEVVLKVFFVDSFFYMVFFNIFRINLDVILFLVLSVYIKNCIDIDFEYFVFFYIEWSSV